MLEPLQERIVRVAFTLPAAHTLALAGGGAMIAHGFVDRVTEDIDLFTQIDDEEAVRVASALRAVLERQTDLTVRDADRPPLDHRFMVKDTTTGYECKVEVFPDGGRLRGRVMLDVGLALHPDDLAADKLLALWARAAPRDFVDVIALLERYSRDQLLALAAEKDRGFTLRSFSDSLSVFYHITPTNLAAAAITPELAERIRKTVDDWRAQLTAEEGDVS